MTTSATGSPAGEGLARSIALFKAFQLEQTDPDQFYRFQADDTIVQLQRDCTLEGALVLDVGGGGGFFSKAMSTQGATVVLVEPEAGRSLPIELIGEDGELSREQRHQRAVWPGRLNPGKTIAGDGYELPFASGTFDLTFSSNVLEHVVDPERFIRESIRVTKPKGIVYVSYTAWFSPNGGHETAPWHYLGGQFAARRYEKKHGKPPGNLYGVSLFRCDIGSVMKFVRQLKGVEVIRLEPRYHPKWLYRVIHVPILREVLTWNLAITFRVAES